MTLQCHNTRTYVRAKAHVILGILEPTYMVPCCMYHPGPARATPAWKAARCLQGITELVCMERSLLEAESDDENLMIIIETIA